MNATITKENATTFDRYSAINATLVQSARACGCEAYKDVFTYKRWQAQGFQVRKGEKGTRIETYAPITKENKETGEREVVGSRPWISTVFCRCQVDAKDAPTPEVKPIEKPAKKVRKVYCYNDGYPTTKRPENWRAGGIVKSKPADGATVTDLTGADFVLSMLDSDNENQTVSSIEITDADKNVKVKGRLGPKAIRMPIVLNFRS